MSGPHRVLVCGEIHEEALQLLTGVASVDIQPGLTPADLQQVIGRYQALIVGDETKVTQDIIEEALNLRVIGSLSPRLDNVDVTAARTMGIEVRNSPSGNAVAVAEHTLALMLQLATQYVPTSGYPVGLAGKTLGIVGFGRTGREVARRAQAFDMNVIANQPRLTPELILDVGIGPTDLRELLQRADYVSLHVPSTAETEAIIGAAELAMMQPHAFLINTGHTDLVDDAALLESLEGGRLAGAALAQLPDGVRAGEAARVVRQHPRVLVAPHITHIIGDRRRDTAITVVQQLVEVLRVKRPSETLSLEVVPVEQVSPHEQIDDKRVHRLMERLKEEARLINPPIVTYWDNHYIILDGATRYSALRRLGYPHVIVQVVDAHRDDFELHTWYHVISDERPAEELLARLESLPDLSLEAVPLEQAHNALGEPGSLCYLTDRESHALLARAAGGADRLDVMNKLVNEYSAWGTVERTLLTDVERLRGQFPAMKLVAIFPQFDPADVFETASHGRLLPAGLTRFVIPGRILRLNADLERLRADEALTAKRAWFNDFLAQKLARSRLRYYQEPVILLDE
jgi:phosphoglycerate dehydrogenase-like enzyme